ncbi:MAG: UDP-N-acetylmuramoyl-tripeptide--D-alanyl-D-alanine ligase [Verrucomicrobiota bacterium]
MQPVVEPRSLQWIAEVCGGKPMPASECAIRRISTDSRTVQKDDLFVAIAGDRFDGHEFLAEVARKGAAAALAERRRCKATDPSLPIILVEDSRRALGQIATKYRRDFNIPIIAVGGSNGKTTTKELLGSVLRQKMRTLTSEASFNNDIGVPLTLLRLEATHEAAVLEVGTNHPGELGPLVELVQPRYGVIPSIGPEHLEFFGDLAGVAEEEGALARALPSHGKLFVNGDSPELDRLLRGTKAEIVRVGKGAANDWRIEEVLMDARGVAFTLIGPHPDFCGRYQVSLFGTHQALNVALVVTVGSELGLSRAEIQRGLSEVQPPKMRLQLIDLQGLRILDDTYNANEDSMRAALQTLRDFPCHGRRVAVLGDMAELGAHSESAHQAVGAAAATAGIDRLVAIGNMASSTAGSARAAGMNAVEIFADVAEAIPALRQWLRPGDLVLVKGSRAARLERVVEALRQQIVG